MRHVDLRTAQRYLGHKRITSTERYLLAASAADGQGKVSEIDFTKPFYGVTSKEPKSEAGSGPNDSSGSNTNVDGPRRSQDHGGETSTDQTANGFEEFA